MDARVPFHRRLALQLGLAVAIVTAVAFGVTGWLLVRQERESLTRELTRRVLSETRSLAVAASAPLLRHDPELGLHPLILKALEETPSLRELTVLDQDERIQGHRDLVKVGEPYRWPEERQDLGLRMRPDEQSWQVGEDILIRQPISHLGQPIGTLVARAGLDEIDAAVAAAVGKLTVIAGIGTALAILAVVLLVALHLRPLHPLRRGMMALGEGDLTARVEIAAHNELGALARLMNSMAEGLQGAQRELIQKERLDRELEIARQLQAGLLPQVMPPAGGYAVRAHFKAALEVSGDYYDLFPLDEDHLAVVAADVSGKGVPGLVVMAMLRVLLRGLARHDRSPAATLLGANAMLHGSIRRGMFVSCLYGILDLRDDRFEYVCAGHCPPALYGHGRALWLGAGGKPIGLFPDAIFRSSLQPRVLELQPGDALLLYTDGLIEAMDADGAQLGMQAVLDLLGRCETPEQTIRTLMDAVGSHRSGAAPSDDLTLIALQRSPRSAPVGGGVAR